MKPQLLSGARGLIQKKGADGIVETLAVATDITINVRGTVRQTFVCGALNPVSLDPTAIDVDVTVGRVIPVNKSNAAETSPGQLAASPTSSIGLGLEPSIDLQLTAEDLTISIQDKITGKYIDAVRNCRFTGRALSNGAEDIANERLTFVGIYSSGYDDAENTAVDLGYGV